MFPRLRLEVCNIDTMYDREQRIDDDYIVVCLTCYPSPPHIRRSMWHVSDRFQSSSTSDERNHVKLHSILPHQKAPKLRFVSSVEFRNSSGKSLSPRFSLYIMYLLWSLEDFIFPSSNMVQYLNITSKETDELNKFIEIYFERLNFPQLSSFLRIKVLLLNRLIRSSISKI